MTRAARLQPLRHLVDTTERRLAKHLAGLEHRLAESEAKLRELECYRREYQQQFSRRAGRGIGAAGLRDYQVFLARLAEAIRQQQALVHSACAQRDAQRQRWQDAARRARALGHVVERWQVEERRSADRREQRESDERAQRTASRP